MLPRPFLTFSPLVVSFLLLAAPAFSQQATPNPDLILVKVDGEPIREKDLIRAAEDLGGGAEAQNRETLISYLIDLKIGAKAALEAKEDQKAQQVTYHYIPNAKSEDDKNQASDL